MSATTLQPDDIGYEPTGHFRPAKPAPSARTAADKRAVRSMAAFETVNGAFSRDIGQGQVLENMLIDAGGEPVDIMLRDGGVMRNVAVINHGRSPSAVTIRCSEGGSAVIDNCFFDNAADNHIFANAGHSGHADIQNTYFGSSSEDHLYGSPPGNPPGFAGRKQVGQGGTITVSNSFGTDATDYGFRLGSDGSKVINSTQVNSGVALANLYGQGISFEGVNVDGANITLRVGVHIDQNAADSDRAATSTVRNSDFNGGEANIQLNNMGPNGQLVAQLDGTPGSNPNSNVPGNVPTTAEQAAAGESTATPAPAPTSPTPGETGGSAALGGAANVAECEDVDHTTPRVAAALANIRTGGVTGGSITGNSNLPTAGIGGFTGAGVPDLPGNRGTRIDVAQRASGIDGVQVSQGNGYTIIKPQSGVEESITVGTDERAENVLIDVSAPRSNFSFNLRGVNPTVRWLGWSGQASIKDHQYSFVDPNPDGGTALIDQVYVGDGSVSSNPGDYGGGKLSHVNKDSRDSIMFRSCNIGPHADNGIYASSVGRTDKSSSKAPVLIGGCYARNCNTANYRLGSSGSKVVNCVSVHNGPVPGKQGKYSARGIWCREGGDIVIENTDFVYTWDGRGATAAVLAGGGSSPSSGSVTVNNCRITPMNRDKFEPNGKNLSVNNLSGGAENTIPPGVPKTAREAASGNIGGNGPTATSLDAEPRQRSPAQRAAGARYVLGD